MTDKPQLEDGTSWWYPPAFCREIYRELHSAYSNEAAEDAGRHAAQPNLPAMAHQLAGHRTGRGVKSSPAVAENRCPEYLGAYRRPEIHRGDFSRCSATR